MSTDTQTLSLTQTETEELIRLKAKLLPPYNVILFNDDYNDMLYVVAVLLRTINRLSRAEAENIMLTAHLNGSAIVVTCPKETAEHYQEQLLGYGLTATIEPE
jgi:ATP-dependent Clp protease adaptor protein ClpS